MSGRERRERERLGRRQDILRSAYELIREEGLAAFTMDGLAQRADMAKGTLYLHFPGRAEVLAALVVQWLDAMAEAFQQACGQATDPLSALGGVGEAWARHARASTDLEPLLEQARTRLFQDSLSQAARRELATANVRPFTVLAQAVAEAQAAGQLSPAVSPMDLALELAAFSMGVLELCACLEGCAQQPDADAMLRKAWSRLLEPLVMQSDRPKPGDER